MFTCISQTSANRVSWMTDIRGREDVAIFTRTDQVGYTIETDTQPGISATLWNNTRPVFNYTLTVNLRNSTIVVNGTGISCGEIDQRMISSSMIPVNIIGNHPNPAHNNVLVLSLIICRSCFYSNCHFNSERSHCNHCTYDGPYLW